MAMDEAIEASAWEIMRTLRLPDDELGACRWLARNFEVIEINEALSITRDKMDTPATSPRNPMAYFRGVLSRRREKAGSGRSEG